MAAELEALRSPHDPLRSPEGVTRRARRPIRSSPIKKIPVPEVGVEVLLGVQLPPPASHLVPAGRAARLRSVTATTSGRAVPTASSRCAEQLAAQTPARVGSSTARTDWVGRVGVLELLRAALAEPDLQRLVALRQAEAGCPSPEDKEPPTAAIRKLRPAMSTEPVGTVVPGLCGWGQGVHAGLPRFVHRPRQRYVRRPGAEVRCARHRAVALSLFSARMDAPVIRGGGTDEGSADRQPARRRHPCCTRAKKSRCARGVEPGTPAGIRNVTAA